MKRPSLVLKLVLLWFSSGAIMAVAESNPQSVLPDFEKAETHSQQKPSIGVFGGMADPQTDRHTTGDYGVEAAFQPYIPISTGAELSGYVLGSQGASPTLTRTRLFAKAAYNFGGDIPLIRYSYVGAGIGPVFDNIGNRIDTELGFAPMIGFDIPMSSEQSAHFSLGANANYLFVGGAKSEVFALNGVAKYWF